MKSLVSLLTAMFVLNSYVPGQQRFEPATSQTAPPVFLRGVDSDSLVDVIVEFMEEPLLLAQRRALHAVSPETYRSRFARFTADIGQATGSALSSQPPSEYFRVFFGVGTSLPERMLSSLEKLSYVKRVHRAKEYRAHLDKSMLQIRVPEAWARFGVKGEGILVAIIDSGIDYLHPALGGGIGPTFKVVGGYDFVNNDSDPSDDNGHGTHVAGIVAADGMTAQGVAPKARLLAYKVLDAQGRGIEREIIAALERAVDPNQDGDLRDMPDIVNMSLGSEFGDADDALSTAVDNAVKLGMTVCVSAGNNGAYTPVQGKDNNYYFTGMETIGSPGTARLAITVGAVDSVNKLARYSSKGPSGGSFSVKPEIVAPGDEIWSLAPGGGFALKSGTSMASPMVAGVAALLKSRNKAITPAEIKSVMMNSSVNIGLPAMKQGAGRIDAMRALTATSYATPGHLSFGLDDPAHMTWTKAETLLVANRNGTGQTYLLTSSGTVPGIDVSIAPQAFSLSSGGTQSVVVTIAVNNAMVPIVDEDILVYDGRVSILGSSDTLHVPWAFVRTSRLLLTFSDPDPVFLGASTTYAITPRSQRFTSKVRWLDARHLEVMGAFNGFYDFAVYFPSAGALVTREQLQFQGSGQLVFNASDAQHEVRFDGRDEDGLPFPATNKVLRTLRVELPSTYPLFVSFPAGVQSLAVSSTSSRFRFHPVESYVDPHSAKRVVLPQYSSFSGVQGGMVLSPATGTYRRQTLRFRVPEGAPRFKFYTDIIDIQVVNGTEYFNTVQIGIDTLDAGGESTISLALMKPVDPVYSSSIAFHVNARDLSTDFLDYSTRYFSVIGDSILASLPLQRTMASYLSPDGGSMTFGGGPVHILNLSYNNILGPSVHFDPRFRGSLLEDRYTDGVSGKYTIYDEAGGELTTGPLNLSRSPLGVTPGRYRVKIESESFAVRRAKGRVVLVNSVDLSKPVPDAPYITSFTVRDGEGKATDQLTRGDTATLRFSSRIQTFPEQTPVADSTKAFYRQHGSGEWLPLPVTLLGGSEKGAGLVFQAGLQTATLVDSSGIDLRIRVVDFSGNASDMVVSPSFAVGSWDDDGTSGVEDGVVTPIGYALDQNYPNPFNPSTTLGYTVAGAGHEALGTSWVRLAVYDVLGREVAVLVDEKKEPGSYRVQFDGSPFSSGVYFYRMSARSLDSGTGLDAGQGPWSFEQTRRLVLLR